MRIYTDKITANDIQAATRRLPGVYATATEHGSRSHERAFAVKLEGNGYRSNPGSSHNQYDVPQSATWDEWGAFLSALYEVDPDALWGTAKAPTYHNADHFHSVTGGRFEGTATHEAGALPADTHKRHTWRNIGPRVFECSKCSAIHDQSDY